MNLLSLHRQKWEIIYIRSLSACVLLFLYLLLSYGTFISTSGGWYAVGYYSLGIIGITVIFAVFILGSLLRRLLLGKRSIVIDTQWMKIVFFLKVGATIFNVGDCGDRAGSYTFITAIITRFIGTREVCSGSAPWILVLIFFMFFATYIVVFLIGFVGLLFQKPSRGRNSLTLNG